MKALLDDYAALPTVTVNDIIRFHYNFERIHPFQDGNGRVGRLVALKECLRYGKVTPVAREIDFIANSGGKKTYIQSAYALGTEEKAITENKPFALTGDSFPKIIVRHDIRKRWYDDNGILNISVIDFLLDDTLV